MGETLRLLFGLVLAAGVAVTGHFLVTALRSRNPDTFTGERNWQSWQSKLYLALGAVGWVAVIAFGLHGILKLLMPAWGDARLTISVLAALTTLPLAEHLDRLPRLRKDYSVLSDTVHWLEENLGRIPTPTAAELERILEQSRDTSKPVVERHALTYRHQMLFALKARDARVKAAVIARQEHARVLEAVEAERARAAASKTEQEAAQLEQLRHAEALVAQRVRPEPLIESVDQAQPSGAVSQGTVLTLWKEFKTWMVDVAPPSPDKSPAAAAQLPSLLTKLVGVARPSTVNPSIVYQGTPRDGYCDAVAVEGPGVVPLYQRLQYEHSISGLVNALLFAAVLPQKWSWGHGCYDRDAELIVNADRLAAVVQEAGKKVPTDDSPWPPPGIRIKRLHDGFEVACLASRPGRGLYDLSVAVRSGHAGPLDVRELFVWGQGVFY